MKSSASWHGFLYRKKIADTHSHYKYDDIKYIQVIFA